MSAAGAGLARVIRGVVAAAVRESGTRGVVVLADWTPEGELIYEWLVAELGEKRVWRAASLDSAAEAPGSGGVHGHAVRLGALLAHPANRTALLLGGRIPHADVFPLGDVPASGVETLAGRWSGPPELEELVAEAGSLAAVDAALGRLIDAREEAAAAVASLPAAAGQQLVALFERGRYFRLRPRLVPKVSARTLGVDLFE